MNDHSPKILLTGTSKKIQFLIPYCAHIYEHRFMYLAESNYINPLYLPLIHL